MERRSTDPQAAVSTAYVPHEHEELLELAERVTAEDDEVTEEDGASAHR